MNRRKLNGMGASWAGPRVIPKPLPPISGSLPKIKTPLPVFIPYYDRARTFVPQSSATDEFESEQYGEGGDGIDESLEFDAGETNATEQAIKDFENGNGLPVQSGMAKPAKEIGPLIVLGALFYFLL